MARMGRRGLSGSQKADLWERWKSGQSLNDIARALGKFPGSIRGVVSSEGGIAPHIRRRTVGSGVGVCSNKRNPAQPCGTRNSASSLKLTGNPRPRVHGHNPEVGGSKAQTCPE